MVLPKDPTKHEEYKNKLRESIKIRTFPRGKDNPLYGIKRPDSSKRMKNNNPMKRPEIAKKCGETQRRLYAEGILKPKRGKENPLYGRQSPRKGKTLIKIFGKENIKKFKRYTKEWTDKYKIKGICPNCGNEFLTYKGYPKKYCNAICMGLYRKNKTLDERFGNEKANEIIEKIRLNAKINPSFGMKGKHHTEETKKRISKLHIGRHLSEDTKKKIKEANSNERCYMYGKKGKDCPNFGRHLSEETKMKISIANKGMKRPDTSIRLKGKKRLDVSVRMKESNPMFNIESLNKRSNTVKKLYKEGKLKHPMLGKKRLDVSVRMKEGGAMKARMANKFKPNRPEKLVIALLNKYFPNKWEYVGDGKFWITCFNPDFINCNEKKLIIEVFGDYWHNTSDAIINDEKRLDAYKKYDYDTLIIWESELKNINDILQRIKNFEQDKLEINKNGMEKAEQV